MVQPFDIHLRKNEFNENVFVHPLVFLEDGDEFVIVDGFVPVDVDQAEQPCDFKVGHRVFADLLHHVEELVVVQETVVVFIEFEEKVAELFHVVLLTQFGVENSYGFLESTHFVVTFKRV